MFSRNMIFEINTIPRMGDKTILPNPINFDQCLPVDINYNLAKNWRLQTWHNPSVTTINGVAKFNKSLYNVSVLYLQ